MTQQQARLLIVGAGGQIGTELVARAELHGFSTYAPPHSELDITSASSITAAMETYRPHAAINAAAYTDVDGAESETELAFSVNGKAPGLLGMACESAGVPILHISTDYVFDGRMAEAYTETSAISPANAYGRSKAAGEKALSSATRQHIILRTAWVFSAHGANFVRTILRLATEREELSVVDDQRGNPTCAADIAETLLIVAKRCLGDTAAGREPPWGVYHFCNAGAVSWYEFAEAIMEGATKRGIPFRAVKPIRTADYPTAAKRPESATLDCTRIEQVFGIQPRPWQEGLDAVLDQLLSGTVSGNRGMI